MEPSAKKKKQILPELPYEIWNQILICIPAKTVIRLKSVCKSWCDLINSHNFQVSHTDTWRNRVPTQLIAKSPYRSTMELLSLDLGGNDTIPSNVRSSTLRFDQLILRRSQRQLSGGGPTLIKDTTTVLDCHDGLFLIRMSKHLYLCNPLTNSYLALPFPKKNNPRCWAVVYDPSTRGYVILGCVDNVSPISVVLSLRVDEMNGVCCGGRKKTGNWRQIWSSENLTLKFPDIRELYFLVSISIDGKVHWLFHYFKQVYGIYTYDTTSILTGILTIDLATEEAIVTKCSNTLTLGCSFFESNKKFYCLKEFSNPTTKTLELWAIDDVDNPKWVKHHEIIKMGHKMRNFYRLPGIVKDENRLIMRSRDSVFIYDLSLQKWHVLDIIDSDHYMDQLKSINFSLLSWLGH